MRDALSRLLDRIVPTLLGLTVVLFAFGSSSFHALYEIGRLRWLALVLLTVAAVAWAAPFRPIPSRTAYGLGCALLGLSALSAVWSTLPRLTLERTISVALVFAMAAAAGVVATARPGRLRPLAAVLAAVPVAIAVGGLVAVPIDSSRALTRVTAASASRLQGIGENPNTNAMLYALVLPVLVWLCATATSRAARVAWAAGGILLAGSIIASDSHGALAASLAGVLLVVGIVCPRRLRIPVAAAIVALYAAGVTANGTRPTQLEAAARTSVPSAATPSAPKPVPTRASDDDQAAARTSVPSAATPSATVPSAQRSAPKPVPTRASDDDQAAALAPVDHSDQDYFELGRPRPGDVPAPLPSRSLFGTSGRAEAWQGALDQARMRPLLGYGFGTEDRVFLDRVYFFQGARPENAYLGFLLQLGIVGAALFLMLGVVLLLAFLRALRRGVDPAAAAFAGSVGAGFLIAGVQSFPYAAGNVATATFWLSVALLCAALRNRKES